MHRINLIPFESMAASILSEWYFNPQQPQPSLQLSPQLQQFLLPLCRNRLALQLSPRRLQLPVEVILLVPACHAAPCLQLEAGVGR